MLPAHTKFPIQVILAGHEATVCQCCRSVHPYGNGVREGFNSAFSNGWANAQIEKALFVECLSHLDAKLILLELSEWA